MRGLPHCLHVVGSRQCRLHWWQTRRSYWRWYVSATAQLLQAAIEPAAGAYDEVYLASLTARVKSLADRGHLVLLDLHLPDIDGGNAWKLFEESPLEFCNP